MEVLWDNRHQSHTSLPWKLQHFHELSMINALLMFHSGCHGSDSLTHWTHKIGNLGKDDQRYSIVCNVKKIFNCLLISDVTWGLPLSFTIMQ